MAKSYNVYLLWSTNSINVHVAKKDGLRGGIVRIKVREIGGTTSWKAL